MHQETEKRIFAFYPPGAQFQRSEDRCQASIDDSLTVTQRACNDLGYIAAISRQAGYTAYIKDYPSEGLNLTDLITDLKNIKPDIVIISVTNATLQNDADICLKIKQILPKTIIILKGAIFSALLNTEIELLKPYIQAVDYAIKGEIEAVLKELLILLKNNAINEISKLAGIIFKDANGVWQTPKKIALVENLDALPFPARDLMNNKLYIRPDTGKPMATIESSRGCPAKCIYCLTPVISGNTTRFRSPENLIAEIDECVYKYNITDFFFRADTFTINKQWTLKVCDYIKNRNYKINWVANARVKPIDYETLKSMADSGCWLVAFGIETGSNETLKKLKKGATRADAEAAIAAAKKAGLKIYAFFMFGFPWETEKDILETIDFAYKLDCDFNEFHLATAFKGTELYEQLPDKKEIIGKNYFSNPNNINPNLSVERLLELRKLAIKKLYLRPSYILKKLFGIRSFYQFTAYCKYGLKTLKSTLK